MYDDAKALPLKGATGSLANISARLPVALLQVHERATVHLRQGLQRLFDNAADTLFEMASQASSETDRLYLQHATNDLRHERKRIERAFVACFNTVFASIDQASPDAWRKDRLSLVGNAELERTVVVDTLVAKVLARDGLALAHLDRRFEALLGKPVGDHDNPLGPALLCECLLRAARSQRLDLQVKALLLSLFEAAVLDDIGTLYAQANQLLGKLGVLPELRAQPNRRAADQAAGAGRCSGNTPSAPAGGDHDASVQAVFASLQGLLPAVPGGPPPGQRGPLLCRHDLMRLLTHLQHCLPLAGAAQAFDVRFELERLLARLNMRSGVVYCIGPNEEDVIRVVSLLFAEIAADENLADYPRRLIVRLQVPLLKVALLDKRLFSQSTHSARRLLDEMANAAVGISEGEENAPDSLGMRIEHIVQRLSDEFVDDVAIFSELLADFLLFALDERRRSELLEQRTLEAEQGRANAELAMQRVEEVLNRTLRARILPRRVIAFIETAWSRVLLLDWLQHGEHSAQWQSGLRTLDELVWSVEPHADAESRLRLFEVVPGLLKSLREGLVRSAFDPFATRDFFNHLEALHVQALETPLADLDDVLQLAVVDEIFLGERPQAVPGVDEPLLVDDAAWAQVAALHQGVWLYLEQSQGQCLRCKVSAIPEADGQFVFVNRTGFKVLEKSAAQLALLFQQGRARVLDRAPLFERALNAMVRRLRERP
ncbi:hypothetical protein D3C76_161380 [compost metagenome]